MANVVCHPIIVTGFNTRNKLFSPPQFALSEDEQRNSQSSQKALHAVTMEKEAALADLNSVERSLSDVFRRYENMKSTLEGFKKVRAQEKCQTQKTS